MSLPGFVQRARLRDDTMLQATILAVLDHLGGRTQSVTCDELVDAIGVGRGRVISACDELVRGGYLTKDRGLVQLTALAIAKLSDAEPEAA